MKKRVLVVDDDYFIQALVEAVLVDLGMQVFQADSVTTALAAVAEHKPALILMDLELSDGESGLTVTRSLRIAGYAGYIVAMSATVGSDIVSAFAAAGSDEFLAKPIDLNQLRKVCLQAGLGSAGADNS